MREFEDFNQWCQYWSSEYRSRIIYEWIKICNTSDRYICKIHFESSSKSESAREDVMTYGQDFGYGHPNGFILSRSSEYEDWWDVCLGCPDLPLVIRIANNHDGHITWWNTKFLEEPKMDIPFYFPPKPKVEKEGCYVATSVYGSYNCPEVWTLRRFRDNTLDETWYGRAFIKTYYAISPTLVKWFGETNWFKKLWRKPLDKLVASLKSKGVEDTPYQDKY